MMKITIEDQKDNEGKVVDQIANIITSTTEETTTRKSKTILLNEKADAEEHLNEINEILEAFK